MNTELYFLKGHFNGKDVAIFQCQDNAFGYAMTSDHGENEINLKSELSAIAMGQFFAKSFKHRLDLHGVQVSCMSNFGINYFTIALILFVSRI